MTDEPRYLSESKLNLDEILRCRAAAAAFVGFVDFSSSEVQHGFFTHRKTLPRFPLRTAITFVDLRVEGQLSMKSPPWDSFAEVLQRGQQIARLGQLRFLCGFEEAGSKQNKRAYDLVGLTVSSHGVSFEYHANGSKVMLGGPYARDFMERLVRELDLPLRLEVVEDRYALTHASSGALWVTGTLGGGKWNPTGFRCQQFPGASPVDSLHRMQKFLEAFATAKRFEYSWSAGREQQETTADRSAVTSIYEMVVDAALPAERFEVQGDFRLNDVTAIETIRTMCGPDDEVYTRLCSFELECNNRGELTVVTRAEGHRLTLTLLFSEGVGIVEERLRLAFTPAA